MTSQGTASPPKSKNNQFKEAREAAGYSVEYVAQSLNIRKQYIVELENGNIDALPGRVYAVGYAKLYAKLLEINLPEIFIDNKTPPGDEEGRWFATLHQQQINSERIAGGERNKYILLLSTISLILLLFLYKTYLTGVNDSNDLLLDVETDIEQFLDNGNNQEIFD